MAQFPEEQSNEGEFERQEDSFRNRVDVAESGRYHLYVSLACPWAHRTIIVRELLGLSGQIGMTIVDPIRDDRGWNFIGPDAEPDTLNGFHYLAEAYLATNSRFHGRVTVPVLWDNQEKRIVNNSEDDICRMLSEVFAPDHFINLFPKSLAAEQDALSETIYQNVNNGVYRAGFASRQGPYERAVKRLFQTLDDLENRLAGTRYLFGDELVETDLRLFCTLIRFDAVYHGHFKCNVRRIIDYPNLNRFLTDLYRRPEITKTVNFDHIKRHYYVTHRDINPTGIFPVGPDLSYLESSS